MIKMPQFPLQLVVFPRETINLHIFEERYRTLIRECEEKGQNFGIVSHINGRLADIGTEVSIKDIVKKYEDGRMDISCYGEQLYKILSFDPVAPSDGYSTAIVEPLLSSEYSNLITRKRTLELLDALTDKISSPIEFDIPVEELHTSQFIHKLGLSKEKELELLMLLNEEDRLLSINTYLERFIPRLDEAEEIRNRIKMNGHFKRLDPLGL